MADLDLMKMVNNAIQQHPELMELTTNSGVMQRLSKLAENLRNLADESVTKEFVNDEEIMKFINVLKPVVIKYNDAKEKAEEEFVKKCRADPVYDDDEKKSSEFKNMELLISGYIRLQSQNCNLSVFVGPICFKLLYISWRKLKELSGQGFLKKVIPTKEEQENNDNDNDKQENNDNDKNDKADQSEKEEEIKLVPTTFDEEIVGNEFILFYFSGIWCPPSKEFTPKLAEWHRKELERGNKIQIIFVSSDSSQKSFEAYYKEHHGDYLAIPFTEKERKNALSKYFHNEYIPSVYVMNDEAKLLDRDARWKISGNDKENAVDQWKKRNIELQRRLK